MLLRNDNLSNNHSYVDLYVISMYITVYIPILNMSTKTNIYNDQIHNFLNLTMTKNKSSGVSSNGTKTFLLSLYEYFHSKS